MSKNKVLLGTPIYNGKKYCWEAWKENLNKIEGDYDLILIDNSPEGEYLNVEGFTACSNRWFIDPQLDPRKTLATAQNEIVDYAKIKGYTHVFFVEQDIFPEPDALNHLLSFNEKVIGNPYFKYSPDHESDYVVWLELEKVPDGSFSAEVTPLFNVFSKMDGKLHRVFNIGVGCCLVEISVFDGIEFRAPDGEEPHSDTYFAMDLHSKGIPFYADTSRMVKHIDTEFNNK